MQVLGLYPALASAFGNAEEDVVSLQIQNVEPINEGDSPEIQERKR
jgi:hypothetical protein